MTGKREPTVVISTRVPVRFLEPIEDRRGRRTRSRWLADLVAAGLGEPSGEARPREAPAERRPARAARPAAPEPAAAGKCPHASTKPHPGSVSGLRKCQDCGEVGMNLGRR